MKRAYIISLSVCLISLLTPSPVFAAKSDGPRAKLLAKYDKNKNGVIDEDEKEAIRKDYAANPDGDLKRFDTNKDGKLDDAEIAAIKPASGKKTEKTGKKGKKAESTDKKEKKD